MDEVLAILTFQVASGEYEHARRMLSGSGASSLTQELRDFLRWAVDLRCGAVSNVAKSFERYNSGTLETLASFVHIVYEQSFLTRDEEKINILKQGVEADLLSLSASSVEVLLFVSCLFSCDFFIESFQAQAKSNEIIAACVVIALLCCEDLDPRALTSARSACGPTSGSPFSLLARVFTAIVTAPDTLDEKLFGVANQFPLLEAALREVSAVVSIANEMRGGQDIEVAPVPAEEEAIGMAPEGMEALPAAASQQPGPAPKAHSSFAPIVKGVLQIYCDSLPPGGSYADMLKTRFYPASAASAASALLCLGAFAKEEDMSAAVYQALTQYTKQTLGIICSRRQVAALTALCLGLARSCPTPAIIGAVAEHVAALAADDACSQPSQRARLRDLEDYLHYLVVLLTQSGERARAMLKRAGQVRRAQGDEGRELIGVRHGAFLLTIDELEALSLAISGNMEQARRQAEEMRDLAELEQEELDEDSADALRYSGASEIDPDLEGDMLTGEFDARGAGGAQGAGGPLTNHTTQDIERLSDELEDPSLGSGSSFSGHSGQPSSRDSTASSGGSGGATGASRTGSAEGRTSASREPSYSELTTSDEGEGGSSGDSAKTPLRRGTAYVSDDPDDPDELAALEDLYNTDMDSASQPPGRVGGNRSAARHPYPSGAPSGAPRAAGDAKSTARTTGQHPASRPASLLQLLLEQQERRFLGQEIDAAPLASYLAAHCVPASLGASQRELAGEYSGSLSAPPKAGQASLALFRGGPGGPERFDVRPYACLPDTPVLAHVFRLIGQDLKVSSHLPFQTWVANRLLEMLDYLNSLQISCEPIRQTRVSLLAKLERPGQILQNASTVTTILNNAQSCCASSEEYVAAASAASQLHKPEECRLYLSQAELLDPQIERTVEYARVVARIYSAQGCYSDAVKALDVILADKTEAVRSGQGKQGDESLRSVELLPLRIHIALLKLKGGDTDGYYELKRYAETFAPAAAVPGRQLNIISDIQNHEFLSMCLAIERAKCILYMLAQTGQLQVQTTGSHPTGDPAGGAVGAFGAASLEGILDEYCLVFYECKGLIDAFRVALRDIYSLDPSSSNREQAGEPGRQRISYVGQEYGASPISAADIFEGLSDSGSAGPRSQFSPLSAGSFSKLDFSASQALKQKLDGYRALLQAEKLSVATATRLLTPYVSCSDEAMEHLSMIHLYINNDKNAYVKCFTAGTSVGAGSGSSGEATLSCTRLLALANAYLAIGNAQQATTCYKQAFVAANAASRQHGVPAEVAALINCLIYILRARALCRCHRYADAEEMIKSALSEYQRDGGEGEGTDSRWETIALVNIEAVKLISKLRRYEDLAYHCDQIISTCVQEAGLPDKLGKDGAASVPLPVVYLAVTAARAKAEARGIRMGTAERMELLSKAHFWFDTGISVRTSRALGSSVIPKVRMRSSVFSSQPSVLLNVSELPGAGEGASARSFGAQGLAGSNLVPYYSLVVAAEIRCELAGMYVELAGLKLSNLSDCTELLTGAKKTYAQNALTHAKASLEKCSSSRANLLVAGILAAVDKNYEEAREYVMAARATDPTNPLVISYANEIAQRMSFGVALTGEEDEFGSAAGGDGAGRQLSEKANTPFEDTARILKKEFNVDRRQALDNFLISSCVVHDMYTVTNILYKDALALDADDFENPDEDEGYGYDDGGTDDDDPTGFAVASRAGTGTGDAGDTDGLDERSRRAVERGRNKSLTAATKSVNISLNDQLDIQRTGGGDPSSAGAKKQALDGYWYLGKGFISVKMGRVKEGVQDLIIAIKSQSLDDTYRARAMFVLGCSYVNSSRAPLYGYPSALTSKSQSAVQIQKAQMRASRALAGARGDDEIVENADESVVPDLATIISREQDIVSATDVLHELEALRDKQVAESDMLYVALDCYIAIVKYRNTLDRIERTNIDEPRVAREKLAKMEQARDQAKKVLGEAKDVIMDALNGMEDNENNIVVLLTCLGVAFTHLKMLPKARTQFKRATDIITNVKELATSSGSDRWLDIDAAVYANLALADLYIMSGKLSNATKSLDAIAYLDKICCLAYELYGLIMEKEASFTDAAKYYESAWLLSKGGATVAFRLAFNYMKAGRHTDAILMSQMALSEFPDFARLRTDVLWAAEKQLRSGEWKPDGK